LTDPGFRVGFRFIGTQLQPKSPSRESETHTHTLGETLLPPSNLEKVVNVILCETSTCGAGADRRRWSTRCSARLPTAEAAERCPPPSGWCTHYIVHLCSKLHTRTCVRNCRRAHVWPTSSYLTTTDVRLASQPMTEPIQTAAIFHCHI
jgi:hypothetical protein